MLWHDLKAFRFVPAGCMHDGDSTLPFKPSPTMLQPSTRQTQAMPAAILLNMAHKRTANIYSSLFRHTCCSPASCETFPPPLTTLHPPCKEAQLKRRAATCVCNPSQLVTQRESKCVRAPQDGQHPCHTHTHTLGPSDGPLPSPPPQKLSLLTQS
jgi:hypothetical protein